MWIIKVIWWLVGLLVPALKPPNPAVEAQAQKDRADSLQSELNAKVQGDAIQDNVTAGVAADPGSLREPDKFKL